ncbi:hypothetical protein [Chishuiella sp.]|uniref:hypothetical protein n=1 Tax=Chishuiella sp. TaxID=1969467 RepID=UPI0028AC738C|nr:hypothetical protein [Chishuiella sp.]
MKYFEFFLLMLSYQTFSQINNKVVDFNFSIPCKLIYTRTIENLDNYSCNYIDSSILQNYSVTINEYKNKINNFSDEQKLIFKREYLQTEYKLSIKLNESTIFFRNDELGEGVISNSKILFEGINYHIKTILILFNNIAYYFNITTNEYVSDDNFINKITVIK